MKSIVKSVGQYKCLCRRVFLVTCFFQLGLVVMLYTGLNMEQSQGVGHPTSVHVLDTMKVHDNPPGVLLFANGSNMGYAQPPGAAPSSNGNNRVINQMASNLTRMYLNDKHFLQMDWPCYGQQVQDQFQFNELLPGLFIYSVFWDDRYNDFDNQNSGVKLRILVVANSHHKHAATKLTCHFTNSSGAGVNTTTSFYEMCENHGKPIGGFFLSCDVPNEVVRQTHPNYLCSVSISAGNSPTLFKVYTTVRQQQAVRFSVCVSPLYGSVSQSSLIEWLELQQILGAQHVVIYDFQISSKTLPILKHYVDMGIVTLVPWKYGSNLDRSSWYHGQLIAVEDCLYRSMSLAEYVVFADLDEYIVPHLDSNWSTMMSHLDSDQVCGFQFNSAFFDLGQGQHQDSGNTSLVTFMIDRRTESVSKMRTKCMVKPSLLFESGIHHISKPITANLKTVRVALPTALLHHYRQCQSNYGMRCAPLVEDKTIIDKYGVNLLRNYRRKVQLIQV